MGSLLRVMASLINRLGGKCSLRHGNRQFCVESLESRDVPADLSIGMNLERILDYNPQWMFKDAFLSSRPWQSYTYTPSTGLQLFDPTSTILVDDRGWPTSLTQTTNTQGQLVQQRLQTAMFDLVGGNYAGGIYHAEWTGNGTLTWMGDARLVSQWDTMNGKHHAEVAVTPTNSGIQLRLDSVDPNNTLKNLHVWMPDYKGQSFVGQVWSPGAETSPFHPLFLERLAPFHTIRFTQPMDTNTAATVHWSDRKPYDYARQASSTQVFNNGLSPEYIVELANELNADAWINMPHTAEDDYVQGMAEYVRDHLEPGRRVYVEWSNEVWNPTGYPGMPWINQQMTLPENAGLTFDQIWAREAKRDFDIWSNVFVGQSDRLVRVLAGQAVNSAQADRLLSDMGTSFDAVAPDAYATFSRPQMAQFSVSTTADQVIDALISQGIPQVEANLRAYKAIADRYSAQLGRRIELLAYEGGALLSGNGQPFAQAFQDAGRSPRMYQVYHDLLRMADSVGLDLFNQYVLTDASPFGDASTLRYQNQPIADAPKYQALIYAINGVLFAPEFRVQALSATADEHGHRPAVFRISRTGDSPAVTLNLQVAGSASLADYTGLSPTISFAAGEMSRDITITPVDDLLTEADETLTLKVLPALAYRVVSGQESASIIIRDDESMVYYDVPLVNPSFETGNLSGWTLTPTASNNSAVVGSMSVDPTAPSGAHQGTRFVWGGGATGILGGGANPAGVSQRIDLTSHALGVDQGQAVLSFTGWGVGNAVAQQTAYLEAAFLDAGGNPLGSTVSSNLAGTSATWTSMALNGAIPIGTRTIELRAFTRRPTSAFSNRAGFDDLSAQVVYPAPSLAPVRVKSVVINDGSAQRSRVTSITVAFDGVVKLPSNPASAFRVSRLGSNENVGLTVDLSSSTGGQTIVRLTFTGAFTESRSLIDGRYSLTILAAQITDALGRNLDGNGDGVAGGDSLTSFHRLFGDSDGDADVDASDLAAFRRAITSTYLWYFDLDSDGSLTAIDAGRIRTQSGKIL